MHKKLYFRKTFICKYRLNTYFLHLRPCYKRFQTPFFYIVVLDSRGGYVQTLGYINMKSVFIKKSYLSIHKFLNFSSKCVGINFAHLNFWLSRGAIPSQRLFNIFVSLGFLKSRVIDDIIIKNQQATKKVIKKLSLSHVGLRDTSIIFKHSFF